MEVIPSGVLGGGEGRGGEGRGGEGRGGGGEGRGGEGRGGEERGGEAIFSLQLEGLMCTHLRRGLELMSRKWRDRQNCMF